MSGHKFSRETRTLKYPAGLVQPQDLLTFIHFNIFQAAWKESGLTDDDLRALEILIMADPEMGDPIAGTGGLRKLRFAPPKWRVGKRGALRIGYVFVAEYSTVGLVLAYAKSGQGDVSAAEKKAIRPLVEKFRAFVERGGKL